MSSRATQLHPAKKKTQLKVVRRRGKKGLLKRSGSRRTAPLAILGVITAVAIVFGVLLEQVVLAQSAFELSSIRKSFTSAEARHEELLLESAKLDSSARIERFARDTLGMVDPLPTSVQYIVADVGSNAASKAANRPPVRGVTTDSSGVAAATMEGSP
jgi:cell division protein FtsL